MTPSELPFLTILNETLILNLCIQPRASKNEICGIQGTELKIRLTSPPVDGAANKLCREFLSDLFGVAKSSVTLLSGETSRHKRLSVRTRSAEHSRSCQEIISNSLNRQGTHNERK